MKVHSFYNLWLLDFCWVKHGHKVVQKALVHWISTSANNATLKAYNELQHHFPQMNLEDKICLQGDENVMIQTEGRDKHALDKERADRELMAI